MAIPKYVIRWDDAQEYRIVNGTEGADTIDGREITDGLYSPIESELIRGFGGDDHIIGGYFSDRIMGGEGNDYLDGGRDGPYAAVELDRLFGQAGDDVINDPTLLRANGGAGNDRITTEMNGEQHSRDTHLGGGTGHDNFTITMHNGSAGYDLSEPLYDSLVIEDFNRLRGDKIKLLADDDTTSFTTKQLFQSLDSNHSGSLTIADGASAFGSITRDGEGDLHVQFGQNDIELLGNHKLNSADFVFGVA